MLSRIRKLIQKKLYDILSHKNGTLIVFIGLVIVIVSAFHFGEAVVEWSHEKYVTVFNSYSDNIASKSFRKRLCLPVPIDVVYTWVNGTDPVLLDQLRELRYEIQEEITSVQETKCSFHNCVPSNMVVLDPLLPDHVTLRQLRVMNKLFLTASRMFVVTMPLEQKNNFTVVELSENKVQNFSSEWMILKGRNTTVSRVYFTSDRTKQHSILLQNTVLMTGFPHTLTSTELKDKLPSNFHTSVTDIKLHSDVGVAVLNISGKSEFEKILELKNCSIDGKTPTFNSANLIWDLRDFSRGEDIASSRFEDNEELRYSLRSLMRFAPWVRHIYIITNGQIPYWLNMDNPLISIVTHEQLFPNKSHLPTFSSPAIETHVHRIEGISDRFIYMNDDVMFGKEVWPDDFYSQSSGHQLYLTWPVPNCNEGCPSNWIKDGYCDKACNITDCDWDGGDCEGNSGNVQLGAGFHGSYDSQSFAYCSVGCANTWIADRYCDVACNIKVCGFDAGDCGVNDYDKLYGEVLTKELDFYFIPSGIKEIFFNLTEVFGENGFVSTAEYNHSRIIRQVAIANKFKILTLVLNSGYNKTSIIFNLTGHAGQQNNTISKNFTVAVDTSIILSESKSKDGNDTSNSTSIDTYEDIVIIEELTDRQRRPQINKLEEREFDIKIETGFNSNNTALPPSIITQLLQIEHELKGGKLTEKGFKKLLKNIRKNYIYKNNNTNLHNSSVPFINKLDKNNTKIHSAIRKLLWLENVAYEQLDNKWYLNRSRNTDYQRGFPWESNLTLISKMDDYKMQSFHSRKLLDTFGDSLRHVNKIYNKAFGFDSRKVPAHMPHMIDKNIMSELQDRFPDEWDETSSHKVRHSRDMQFAFSFYYYIMGVTVDVEPVNIFDEIDTDHSGVLSDREIRTLAARLYDLPLYLELLTELENIFSNCSKHLEDDISSVTITETYYDKAMPQVTRNMFLTCEPLVDLIKHKFKPQHKYKFSILDDSEVSFKMIKTNVSSVVGQLDDIRKNPKKFICINDNIEHGSEEAQTVKAILQDFYESMFPIKSDFELPRDYRNRFLHIDELLEWRSYRDRLRIWTYVALVLLVLITIATFLGDKIEDKYKMFKQYSNRKRKHSVSPSLSINNTQSPSIITV